MNHRTERKECCYQFQRIHRLMRTPYDSTLCLQRKHVVLTTISISLNNDSNMTINNEQIESIFRCHLINPLFHHIFNITRWEVWFSKPLNKTFAYFLSTIQSCNAFNEQFWTTGLLVNNDAITKKKTTNNKSFHSAFTLTCSLSCIEATINI